MTHDELDRALEPPGLPSELGTVVGAWPLAGDPPVVYREGRVFWWAVRRHGLAVTTTRLADAGLPYRHEFAREGVAFCTGTDEPILALGTPAPGYVLRLT